MQKTKILISLLSISFLSACVPEIRDLEQKNLRLVLDIDKNGRRYINEDESACFTRFYRHSKSYIGPVGQEKEMDVMHCDDVVGYDSQNYVDLATFFEEVRKKINKKVK